MDSVVYDLVTSIHVQNKTIWLGKKAVGTISMIHCHNINKKNNNNNDDDDDAMVKVYTFGGLAQECGRLGFHSKYARLECRPLAWWSCRAR